MSPLDLHVLGTPPAFVLSQDQTLPFNPVTSFDASLFGIFAVFFLIARLFPLYRFQGSLRSVSRVFSQASLTIIPDPLPLVKVFFAFFENHQKSA